MALGTNSYGTLAELYALIPRYLSAGALSASTRPTLTQAEKFIDQASANINVMLAAAGFTIPVTQADAASAIGSVVIETAAEMCHYANSAGRFYTDRALERGQSPMRVLRQEMADWVEAQADGLEALGAARPRSLLGGMLYRDEDEGGDATFPIFQRDGFSNTFTDWDGDA